jgi:hypothetical protein
LAVIAWATLDPKDVKLQIGLSSLLKSRKGTTIKRDYIADIAELEVGQEMRGKIGEWKDSECEECARA